MKEREPVQKPMYMGSEEITISGGNEGVKMDERSYQAGQIRNERIRRKAKVGEIGPIQKVHESSLKWYGHVLR